MPKNAIEQIYDQLVQVFGGTNPNQFFTMLMPATTLDQASYAYDTSGYKPAMVAAAESRLADQMFDIAKATGGSNGQRLSSQYMQALNNLVPKFDRSIVDVKNTLRDFINSPVPENAKVGDLPFKGSLQEYYFALYERWLKFKSEWETKVFDYKKTHPEEEFLEWFESHAEGELAKIDAAMGEILAVFSPADMEAILGVLEAGPGGEVEEAVQTVLDIRVPSPSGGYNYPIDFIPDDWFLDLASDINPVDLLQDPQFIAITISTRRQAISASISQIQALLAQVPSNDQIKEHLNAFASAQSAYTDAQSSLLNTYTDNTVTAVEMYLSHTKEGDAKLDGLNADVAKVSAAKDPAAKDPAATRDNKNGPLTDEDFKKLVAGQKNLINAQATLLKSSQDFAAAGMNLASDQARSFGDLPVLLARLQSQLNDLEDMKRQLTAASTSAINAQPLPLVSINTQSENPLPPPSVAKSDTSQRFMTMQFLFTSDEMSRDHSESSQFKQTSWSVDLFFGSASGQDTSSSAASSTNSFDTSTAIEIGFKAAKVDISRGWFDPGVFKLSSGMNRLSETAISTGTPTLEDWNDRNEINLKKADKAILPCFPVAFVVAKDVTIRFQTTQSSLSAVKSVVDSRSSAGGGFLCFSVSSSSASHSETSGLSSKTEGNVISITMPGPQILGWFLEFTPKDDSQPISNNEASDYLNITQFVNNLKRFSAK